MGIWVSSNAATVTWINTSGGSWSTAANWSPPQVPGPADSVMITTSGSYTLTLSSGAQVTALDIGGSSGTQTLTVTGGTLSVSNGCTIEATGVLNLNGSTLTGSLNVNGTFNCNGGTIGPRSAVTVLNTGIMNVTGNFSASLYGVLTNAGTVNWSSSSDLYVYNSPSQGYTGGIVNQAGAVFNVQNDRSMISESGIPYVINAGTFQKSAGSNTMMNLAFTNTGTLNLASGNLTLSGGGASTGTITGAGSMIIGGNGTMVLSGAVPNLNISGGATVNGQSLSISNLTWSNGTLQGNDTLTGVANWTGGSLGGGSVLTIAPNAVLNINGNSSVSLYGALVNAGTVNWSSAGDIYVYNSAQQSNTGRIVNQAGGLFNAQNNRSIVSEQGYPDFSNAGTFQKSAGTNNMISLLFTNTGTLNLASGSLTLNGGGASTGTITGSGSVIVSGNTTLVLSGSVPNLNITGGTVSGQNLSISNLTWSSGTLQGTDTVTALGSASGGTLGAGSTWTIAPGAVLNIVGSSSPSLYGTLVNSGTVNWSSSSGMYLYNYASAGDTGAIVNQAGGLFNVQNDQVISSASGNPYFNNAGILQKSAGTNTTLYLALTNTGTLNLASGNLTFNGGGASSGTITGPGSITSSGSGTLVLSGSVPTLNLSGGTVNGQNVTISNLNFNSGTLQGNDTLIGLASWTGGTLGGGGTMTVAANAVLNISGNSSPYLYGTLVNSGTVNWSSTSDLYLYNSSGFTAGIVNQAGGLFNVQNDRTISSGTGSPSFSNAGTFQKSAGTNTTINIPFNNTGTISLGIYDRNHYGRINFSGNAVLSGSLAVNFNPYSPYAGDSFALVTYGSENGVFSSVNVPLVGPWQTNLVNYGPNAFTLTIGSAYNLGFISGPAGTNSAGLPFSPFVVQVQNSDGTGFATNGVPVTIALTGGTGILGGTSTQTTDSSGKATFNDLTVNLVGQKTITASAAAWVTPVSTNVTIVPGPPAQLRLLSPITVSPQKNGYPIVPAPVVQVLDAPGNVVSNATVAIAANSLSNGGGSLGGAINASANGTNGTASFNNFYYALKTNTAESVTIYFTSPGLTPATNNPITVEFVCGLITLADGNSVVQIDPNTSNGMIAWTVDGTDQLSQHWFWLQAGTNNTQVSIDQFGTPLGLSLTPSAVSFNYIQTGLVASLSFTLTGGTPGSHVSTLTENVSIQNTTNSSATWHFYEYTDFDLAGSTDGDTISFPGTNIVVQQGKGTTATQILGGPTPSFWEASWYALTLDTLQSPTHAILSDKIDQPMPGDQSFAYQWDLTVSAGQSFTLNLTNTVLAQVAGLSIALSGANTLLSWSTNAPANLKLQSNNSFDSSSAWGDVASAPVVVGGNYQVTVSLNNNAQFFRLH